MSQDCTTGAFPPQAPWQAFHSSPLPLHRHQADQLHNPAREQPAQRPPSQTQACAARKTPSSYTACSSMSFAALKRLASQPQALAALQSIAQAAGPKPFQLVQLAAFSSSVSGGAG